MKLLLLHFRNHQSSPVWTELWILCKMHPYCTHWITLKEWHRYLSVYNTLPSFQIRSIRLGVVIQWASAFFEFLKNVSGIQIFPTMLLFNLSTFIVLLNLSRLSYQVWAKNISIVYSCSINKNIRIKLHRSQTGLNFKISAILLGTAFVPIS